MLLPRINCSFLQASDEILALRRWSVLKSDIGWFTSCLKSNWSSLRTLENLVFHWYERGNFSLEKKQFSEKKEKNIHSQVFSWLLLLSCVTWANHTVAACLSSVLSSAMVPSWLLREKNSKLRKLLLLNRKIKNFQSLNKTSAASQRLFTFSLYLVVQQTQEECIGGVGTLSVYN